MPDDSDNQWRQFFGIAPNAAPAPQAAPAPPISTPQPNAGSDQDQAWREFFAPKAPDPQARLAGMLQEETQKIAGANHPDAILNAWRSSSSRLRGEFPNLDPDQFQGQMMDAADVQRRNRRLQSAMTDAQKDFDENGEGMFHWFASRTPFAGVAVSATDAAQLYHAGKAIESGDAGDRDYQRVAEALVAQKAAQQRGFAGQAFDVLSHLPAMIGEWAMTGGAGAAGREAVEGIAARMLGNVATSTAGRFAVKGIGAIGEGAARTAAMAPLAVPAGTMQQLEQSPNQSPWEAAGKAGLAKFIENTTFATGHFPGFSEAAVDGIAKRVTPRVGQMIFDTLHGVGTAQAAQEAQYQAGVSSQPSAARQAISGDSRAWNQLFAETAAFGLVESVKQAASGLKGFTTPESDKGQELIANTALKTQQQWLDEISKLGTDQLQKLHDDLAANNQDLANSFAGELANLKQSIGSKPGPQSAQIVPAQASSEPAIVAPAQSQRPDFSLKGALSPNEPVLPPQGLTADEKAQLANSLGTKAGGFDQWAANNPRIAADIEAKIIAARSNPDAPQPKPSVLGVKKLTSDELSDLAKQGFDSKWAQANPDAWNVIEQQAIAARTNNNPPPRSVKEAFDQIPMGEGESNAANDARQLGTQAGLGPSDIRGRIAATLSRASEDVASEARSRSAVGQGAGSPQAPVDQAADLDNNSEAGGKASALPPDATADVTKIAGSPTTIEAHGFGDGVPARYAVADLADLKPSHSYATGRPVPTPDYPEGLQPRDYKIGSGEDRKVLTMANAEKPDFYISNHPGADNGPPTVTSDGTVLNGNGRTMSLQLAAHNGRFDWYKDRLVEDAQRYGIDPDKVAKMANPVLVRVADGIDPRGEDAIRFARAGNVSATQAQSPVRTAASLNGLIDSDIIRGLNFKGDESFSDIVTNPSGGRLFRERLFDRLPPTERDRYFNQDRTLTDAGRELASDMLLTKFLPVDLVERLGTERRQIKRAVEGVIPQLMALRSQAPESDVSPQLVEALGFLARNERVKSTSDAANALDQRDLFTGKPAESLSPGGRMMVDFLLDHSGSPRDFRQRLVSFVKGERANYGLFKEQAGPFDPVQNAADILGVKRRENARFGMNADQPLPQGEGEPGSKLRDWAERTEQEAGDRLKAKLGGSTTFSNPFFDPETVSDLAKYVAAKIINTGYKLTDFARDVVNRFGDDAKPHVQEIWDKAQREAGAIKERLQASRNAVIDRERKARGLEAIDSVARQGWKETWDKAEEALTADPELGRKKVADYLAKPRAFENELDQAVVLQERIGVQNDYDKALAASVMSPDPSTRAEAKIKAAELRDRLDQADEVLRAGGSALGGSLNARKMMIRDDFSLARMTMEKESALGRKLTDPEQRKVIEQQRKIADVRARLEVAEQAMAAKRADGQKIGFDSVMKGGAYPLRLELEKLQNQFRTELLRDRQSQKGRLDWGLDLFTKIRREFVLSSPRSIEKIGSAVFQRMTSAPLEELVGAGVGKVAPGLAKRASGEGGFNVRAEVKAITSFFTTGMKDAAQQLVRGASDLDLALGKPRIPPALGQLFTRFHAALKAPLKRAAFERSFEKRTAWAIENGLDPATGPGMLGIAAAAYKDANRAIFLGDSRVVDGYNKFVANLESPDPDTGKRTLGGKAGATLARYALPVVRVPWNYAKEAAFSYAFGVPLGGAKLAAAYARGIGSLQPAEANAIMSQLKKGVPGAALILLGYLKADQVGGYYQPGQKRDDDKVGFGGIRVFGYDIPRLFVHNPLLESLQIGATIRHVRDSIFSRRDPTHPNVALAMAQSLLGLAEETPFVREAQDVGKLTEPRGLERWGESQAKSFVPAGVQWLAEQRDKDKFTGQPLKRKPDSFVQEFESAVPGLREKVPVKSEGTLKKPGQKRL